MTTLSFEKFKIKGANLGETSCLPDIKNDEYIILNMESNKELLGLIIENGFRYLSCVCVYLPKNDILIQGDEARLEQVWINLINNAIKYTNEHGVVTIDVKKNVKDVEVSIADTGVGMSKEAISHIFERFYRQDKSRKVEGNGLGLSIVKRIIDLHQGTIEVVSQEDAGSVFTVKLPIELSFHIGKLNLTKGGEKG